MPRDTLKAYWHKRRARGTPEPFGGAGASQRFVVQKHAARRLHYDLRLEFQGVLKSWAVPKGPSLDPSVKRLAVRVEDHPLDYCYFEGIIPPDNYGAGAVIVWDFGMWLALEDLEAGFHKGKLLFELQGYKLRGVFTLVRTHRNGGDKEWLLIKKPDMAAAPDASFSEISVLSGLEVDALASAGMHNERLIEKFEQQKLTPQKKMYTVPSPMLANVAPAPFSDANWLFELKYDGYRLMAHREGTQLHLFYRRGKDVTERYPEVARALLAWPITRFILDGELVVHDAEGMPSFQRLQQRALLQNNKDIALASVHLPAVLYAFDALMLAGVDLRHLGTLQRKDYLAGCVPPLGPVRYADHVRERGADLFNEAARLGLEGVMAKDATAPYQSGRSGLWLKIPAHQRDTFTVVGFSAPQGSRTGFGALHIARTVDDGLQYAGGVGSGFDEATLRRLHALMVPWVCASPACQGSLMPDKDITWIAPRFFCEVRYKHLTSDGMARHAIFERWCDELHEPVRALKQIATAPPPSAPEVIFSNTQKIFWPAEGFTKGDLLAYYEAISPWLLPYLRDRPLVLTRYPDGIDGKSFFQKDAPSWTPDWVHTVRMWSESTEREIDYFVCNDLSSLLYVVNLGTIPLHIWSSRITTLQQPDWCILDLDPKGAPFAQVVRLARCIYRLCRRIGLPAFVKTSGSTGMHVLVPLQGKLTYEQARTLADLLARVVVEQQPEIATLQRVISARQGRVYIDTGQNGHGRLLAAPFSARPVPLGLVSMPLNWREVREDLNFHRFNLRYAPQRLQRMRQDPLLDILTTEVDIIPALGRLETLLK